MTIQLLPLDYNMLKIYLQADDLFEKMHGLQVTGRKVSQNVKSMVEKGLLPAIQRMEGSDYLYKTFWIVILKDTNTIVAELGFKGVPNSKGDIEIGYGTMPGYTGKGYMTEAVRQILSWAEKQPPVKRVLAETLYNNLASQRVLEKNGFVQFDKRKEMLWWKKEMI